VTSRYAFLVLFFFSGIAQAHKLAPSLLQLTEQEQGQFEVFWKTPTVASSGRVLHPMLPANCTALSDPQATREGTAAIRRWQVKCRENLVGQTVAVAGMPESGTATLVKLKWADGSVVQQLVTAQSPQMIVPERQSVRQTVTSYLEYGVGHILLGFDHLLFVLALVLLVRDTRRLVWTITMFTVGHSVTLSFVALGLVRFPVTLIEFAIALSIFVLAVELSRSDKPVEDHWILCQSWLVALGFGLLHGMGFAGALSDLGLPARDLLWALFSFNVGIEIGQIAFILCSALVITLGARQANRAALTARWATIYIIGSMSAYWSIGRGAAFFLGEPG
jgi:hydrogenase/urease accessory protein HupE